MIASLHHAEKHDEDQRCPVSASPLLLTESTNPTLPKPDQLRPSMRIQKHSLPSLSIRDRPWSASL